MEEGKQRDAVLSMKDWLITMIITIIPIVGLVMMFVWAFSSTENLNRSNWAKAALIIAAIGIVLGILFSIVTSLILVGVSNQY